LTGMSPASGIDVPAGVRRKPFANTDGFADAAFARHVVMAKIAKSVSFIAAL
jgi:hypothetical protein